MTGYRTLALRLESQADEFKVGIQDNFFNPNSIINHFPKEIKLQ